MKLDKNLDHKITDYLREKNFSKAKEILNRLEDVPLDKPIVPSRAVHYASLYQYTEIADLLIKKGAFSSSFSINSLKFFLDETPYIENPTILKNKKTQ